VANREQFVSELKKQGFRILPSKANFVFAKPPAMGGEAYYQALRDRNILVRHFKHPSLSDFVRITIGTWEELNQILIANKEMGLSPVGKGEEA
jgi:histidinol-phosphate aminotransferase